MESNHLGSKVGFLVVCRPVVWVVARRKILRSLRGSFFWREARNSGVVNTLMGVARLQG